jgi:adenylosuccinate synthase
MQINQSNLKFLDKLEKIKPFTQYVPQTYSDRYSRQGSMASSVLMKPVTKKKIIETEKENSRIFFRMKAVSSTLGRDKLANEYAKAQQIKERITKYAKQDNRIELKYK